MDSYLCSTTWHVDPDLTPEGTARVVTLLQARYLYPQVQIIVTRTAGGKCLWLEVIKHPTLILSPRPLRTNLPLPEPTQEREIHQPQEPVDVQMD